MSKFVVKNHGNAYLATHGWTTRRHSVSIKKFDKSHEAYAAIDNNNLEASVELVKADP